MSGMARDEIPELRVLRDEYDRVRDALMAGITKYLNLGESNARIARSVDWTREYIARIRKERDAKSQAAGQPADPRSPKRPDSSAASSDVDPMT